MALKDKWTDKIDGQDYVNSNDVNTIAQELIETQEELAQNPLVGEKGDDGATFTPSVSADGVISWTNDKGLTNPTPRNIKGNTGTTGAKGDNGVTPHIGANGNWWIGDADTGVKARGDDGANGEAGIGIASITQTTKSTADDGVNIITITLTNGATQTFEVQNGSKGSQGEQGPAGADGAQGPEGPTGATGPQGPAGEAGPKGETGPAGADGKSVIALTYDIDGRTTGSSGVSYLIKKEYYPDAKENDVGVYFGEDETYCEKGTIGIIEGVSVVQPTYLVFKPVSNVKGADGKGAYEYAQEGGYTGAEEEFGEKLAEVGNSQWQATFETNIALPIISEQTVTISQKGVTFTWDDGINLVVGNTYTVMWNGVKYICTCYIDMEGYPALGDDNLWSATSGTYPFYISRQSNTTIWIYKETIGQEIIAFSILDGVDGEVYNTLPAEYLPEDVVTIEQLEAAISGAIAESY